MTRSAAYAPLLAALLASSGVHASPPRLHLNLHYRSISFRDFVVDGPTLARKSMPVELTGLYTRQGEEAVLYENENAYIMEHVGQSAGSTPTIPLLTDGASHRFREMQYSCDSQQAYGRYGCLVIVRGVATICDLTNAFGVETESPCIDVADGSENDPSSPTPAPAEAQPEPSVSQLPPSPASPPQTDATEAIRAFQQKVTHCMRSIRMFGQADVYHKCVRRVQAETSASLAPSSK
jgi:hypothetical protein